MNCDSKYIWLFIILFYQLWNASLSEISIYTCFPFWEYYYTHSLRQDFSLYFYFYLINWVLYPTNLLSFISINSPSHWLVLIWDWFCFCGLSFAFAQSQRLCLGVNWRQVCLSVPPHSTSLFITHTPNTVSHFLSAGMPWSSDLGG